MKRGSDMTGQLSLQFEWEPRDAPDERIAKAEAIIEKYLTVAEHVSDFYDFCIDRDDKDRKKWMPRYYEKLRMMKEAGIRAIKNLHLPCLYFFDVESKYNSLRSQRNATQKLLADKIKLRRKQLDAFGYIQQEHDLKTATDPDRIDECMEPDGTLLGYWYWLFEDPISDIPVPEVIINKYIDKYGTKENTNRATETTVQG